MNRKALALIAASSLATSVGVAGAADLDDEVSQAIDLPSLAEMILTEFLSYENSEATDALDESFALAIGFTLGIAFTSDGASFTDALSEGYLLTSGPDTAAFIDVLTETYAGPGVAVVYTGFDGVALDLAPNSVNSANEVSPE